MNYYFIGISGIGMSALANIFNTKENMIIGSDRYFDKNQNIKIKNKLLKSGIKIVNQNAGILKKYKIDRVIVSTAIDPDSMDIKDAAKLKIKILHRSKLLSEIVDKHNHTIAITGTSGKSTITAITGYIFYIADKSPTIINGAFMNNFKTKNLLGNSAAGNKKFIIFESDESDGSLLNYFPETAAISNISLDHKKIDELKKMFKKFSMNVKQNLVINCDCPILKSLNFKKINVTPVSLNTISKNIKNVRLNKLSIAFNYKGLKVKFNCPGKYNFYNLLISIKIAEFYKIKKEHIVKALNTYKGLYRRFDIKLKKKKIIVLDDYAHNPDKIKHLILSLQKIKKYRYLIFQPHGFGPTKLMFDEYISTFKNYLTKNDYLLLLPVYYAGGKINKVKDSYDIYKTLKDLKIKNVFYYKTRKNLLRNISNKLKEDSIVATFGARDNSLNSFAKEIGQEVSRRL